MFAIRSVYKSCNKITTATLERDVRASQNISRSDVLLSIRASHTRLSRGSEKQIRSTARTRSNGISRSNKRRTVRGRTKPVVILSAPRQLSGRRGRTRHRGRRRNAARHAIEIRSSSRSDDDDAAFPRA